MTARFRSALVVALGLACLPVAARADDAETHYRMCLSHKKAGHLEVADEECRKAIALRKDHAAAYYTLGTLLRQRGKYEEAAAAFRTTRELEPKGAIGWAGEGATLLRLHRLDDAKDVASIGNLGNALRKQDKPEDAVAAYRKALAIAPQDEDILNNLAVALRALGRNQEAIDTLTKALAKRPGDALLEGNLAKAFRAEKRFGEAIPHYEAATRSIKTDAGLYFDLGFCYEETQQKDKAIDAYRKHLELVRGQNPNATAYVQELIDKLEKSRK